MVILRVLTIIAIFSFISIYAYGLGYEKNIDSCMIDTYLDINPTLIDYDTELLAHGGGLNKCGCHFNRKTGECHCHRNRGCGCECQPSSCE